VLPSKEECGVNVMGKITRRTSMKPTAPLSDFLSRVQGEQYSDVVLSSYVIGERECP